MVYHTKRGQFDGYLLGLVAKMSGHCQSQTQSMMSQVKGRAQLEVIIELIFKKAVTEPHYSFLLVVG